jgi:exopolysaccharide production protein ExoF
MLSRHQTPSPPFADTAPASPSATGPRRRWWLLGASLTLPLIGVGVAYGPGVLTGGRSVPWPQWGKSSAVVPLRDAAVPRSDASRPAGTQTGGETMPDGSTIVPGDRIRLTFLENVSVPLTESGGTGRSVAAVFPRTDLSGEYLADAVGAIEVAKLGRFAAYGRTPAALREAVIARFRGSFGRDIELRVELAERQPVYVLGDVRSPGAQRYMPGMVVLQALALSGDNAPPDTSRAIESIRQAESLRQLQAKLIHLQVREAGLKARRDDLARPALPDDFEAHLPDSVASQDLGALIAAETLRLHMERERFQRQWSLAERSVSAAKVEVAAHLRRSDQLKALLDRKNERLHALEGVSARGNLPQFTVETLGSEVLEVGARLEDNTVSLVQAQRRVAEAEIARDRLLLTQQADIDAELRAVQQDIGACRDAMTTVRSVLRVLGPGVATAGVTAGPGPKYRITRRTDAGLATIDATDRTPLQPGDILEVHAASSLASDSPADLVATSSGAGQGTTLSGARLATRSGETPGAASDGVDPAAARAGDGPIGSGGGHRDE